MNAYGQFALGGEKVQRAVSQSVGMMGVWLVRARACADGRPRLFNISAAFALMARTVQCVTNSAVYPLRRLIYDPLMHRIRAEVPHQRPRWPAGSSDANTLP